MFFPRPDLFKTPSSVAFSPRAVARNLRDALVFLAAIPLAEAAERLYGTGWLSTFCLP
jgi:hypothetical protein